MWIRYNDIGGMVALLNTDRVDAIWAPEPTRHGTFEICARRQDTCETLASFPDEYAARCEFDNLAEAIEDGDVLFRLDRHENMYRKG